MNVHSDGSGFGSNGDEPLDGIVSQGGRLVRESVASRLQNHRMKKKEEKKEIEINNKEKMRTKKSRGAEN